LKRPPEDISLLDIIRIIDPAPLARPTSLASSNSAAVQAIRGIWQDIQAEQQRQLEELTLADLVRRSHQSSTLSYQI
jgi:DNA-binding IscR family transcriptional regulator